MAGFSKIVFDEDGTAAAAHCDVCGKERCFCQRGLAPSSSAKAQAQPDPAAPVKAAHEVLKALRARKKAGEIKNKALFKELKRHLSAEQKAALKALRARKKAGEITAKELFRALKAALKGAGKRKREPAPVAPAKKAKRPESSVSKMVEEWRSKGKKRDDATTAVSAAGGEDGAVLAAVAGEDAEEVPVTDTECRCIDCQGVFVFTAADKESYISKGWSSNPTRCKPCRKKKKERNQGRTNAKGERTPPHLDEDGKPKEGYVKPAGSGRTEAATIRKRANRFNTSGFVPKPNRDAPQEEWDAWKVKMGFMKEGESASGKNAVCFLFKEGRCEHGEQCRFSHDLTPQTSSRSGSSARTFTPRKKPAGGRLGKREREKRGKDAATQGLVKKGPGNCRDFHSGVTCKFGDECRFTH